MHVYEPDGKEIGFIRTNVKTGNVAFGRNHVYICANNEVLRVPTRTDLRFGPSSKSPEAPTPKTKKANRPDDEL